MEPLVTIGMPIFNEDRYLNQALESLLAQSYKNIEIIIFDNSSTDLTHSICEFFCSRESRVHYTRHDVNVGASANFLACLKNANGKYFMWASGHDLWSVDYVAECVQLMQKNENAVLAYGLTCAIDEADKVYAKQWAHYDTRGLDPISRANFVLWGSMNPVLGVFRASALRQCKAIYASAFIGADLAILIEAALLGDFLLATGTSWSRREFRTGENFKARIRRYQHAGLGLFRKESLKSLFPFLILPYELLSVVWRSRVRFGDKLMLSGLFLALMPIKYIVGKRRVS